MMETDKDYEVLLDNIKEMANQIKALSKMAVYEYGPQVDALCRRKGTENEVGLLIDYMFSFLGDPEMLLLFKKLCRHYFDTYPCMIHSYILDYRKEYDRKSLVGTEYEYLLKEDNFDEDDEEI